LRLLQRRSDRSQISDFHFNCIFVKGRLAFGHAQITCSARSFQQLGGNIQAHRTAMAKKN
jgi:hypothetical protein